ncbi:MAG TPA: recombinase family protein [Myxococcales bacterium]|nr:recombinase family protein [Myxococcales bacterium]
MVPKEHKRNPTAHFRVARRPKALLMVKLDRLTRSVADLGTLVERYFGQGKAALLSVGEQIDTSSAAGRLVLNVLASVSQ